MTKILATYRYIPFGTKVHVVSSNNLADAMELYAKDKDLSEDYSTCQALFIEGEGNECYLTFRSNVTISDIIHEVTHMVEHVMDNHGIVEDEDEYSEMMAYGISFWSELVLCSFMENIPMGTAWIKDMAKKPDQYLF